MKKLNLKIIVLGIMIILILTSGFSIYKLNEIASGDMLLKKWNSASERDNILKSTDDYYLPIEALTIVFSFLLMYTLYKSWGEELTEGKIYKVGAFVILVILATLYGLYNYMIIVQSKTTLANSGKIINIKEIVKNLTSMGVLFILSQTVRKSILKDMEEDKYINEGTDYQRNWIHMSEKIKDINNEKKI